MYKPLLLKAIPQSFNECNAYSLCPPVQSIHGHSFADFQLRNDVILLITSAPPPPPTPTTTTNHDHRNVQLLMHAEL